MAESQVLVALLRDKNDFAILQSQGWYRIPVEHTPKRWPPEFIAFYQPGKFGQDAFRIRYYGKIDQIDRAERRVLFPNEMESSLSGKIYHRIYIEKLEELPSPIPTRLPRPIVFISTTFQKFLWAEELNDLFDESPLEDVLWKELKHLKLPAERQWPVFPDDGTYRLDFAFFCNNGKLDVETDGDTWHIGKEQVALDNQRNNALEALGWHVLRFNSHQIKEQCKEYCLPKIQEGLNNLGGLVEDGLVPRKFFNKGGVSGQQLSLFDEKAIYSSDTDMDYLD